MVSTTDCFGVSRNLTTKTIEIKKLLHLLENLCWQSNGKAIHPSRSGVKPKLFGTEVIKTIGLLKES